MAALVVCNVPLWASAGLGISLLLTPTNLYSGFIKNGDGIDLTAVANELGAYFRVNNKEVKNWVYQEAQAAQYMRTITKVKGKFPAFQSVTGNVIQGFTNVWNEIGTTTFKVNELVAYHQKVNFPIVPADVNNTWLAELDQENLTPAQKPISQYIAQNELKPRVVADLEYLIGNGSYDANNLGVFGKSMNGLITILQNGIVDPNNSMYAIPCDPLTDNTILNIVTLFERRIPMNVRNFVNKIYMSTYNKERYMLDYENQFGRFMQLSPDQALMTRTGRRQIIGLDCLNGSDFIFATPDNNFLKLIDSFDAPQVTDIQVLDYKVKIFMEFWLGVGFWSNQMVMVSVTNGSGSGLRQDQNLFYLPGQVTPPTP